MGGNLLRLSLAVALGAAAQPASAVAQNGTPPGEWHYWGGDAHGTHYAALDQIDGGNFDDLEVAWIWRGDNFGTSADNILRATPIYAEGKLFSVAGDRRQVMAIDATTGETLWTYREPHTERWERSMRKNYGKGVAYDVVNGEGRIYMVSPAFFLHALDAETGRPIEGFGKNGVVDMLGDVDPDRPFDPDFGYLDSLSIITSSSPPIVVDGVVVVGNSHEQGYYQTRRENVPGNIVAYDAGTGEHLWTFNVIPQEGEFGNDTWESDAWKYAGNVSSWAPMSADPELGLVYAVTDGVTIDYYGGFYPGDNLFATSIIALDARTGERRWHYQTVHHDVWNYDNPWNPILLDITVDGQDIPALVQTTKQGFTYVLNRRTGEPVWPIEERPVPQSDVPGEQLSPTQPFPTKPAPFEMQGLSEDDLANFTPEVRQKALEIVSNYRMGPLFNPPSIENAPDGTVASIHCPGANGGNNIPGGTVADPETNIIYVSSQRGCSAPRLVPGTSVDPEANVEWVSVGPGGVGSIDGGLPVFKPPYSTITAIDMDTGEHVWQIPSGRTPERIRNHPLLEGVDVGNTGSGAHATPLMTSSLLIYGAGRGAEPVLYAVDKMTGKELGSVTLPAPTNTAPMTFMHEGKQYIIAAVGGREMPGSLVALTLP